MTKTRMERSAYNAGRSPRVVKKKSEEILQDSIIELAKLLGYLHYHTHDSRRSPEGFPDLVLAHVKTGVVLWIECKSEHGELSDDQAKWGRALVAGNARYFIFRPHDWAGGTVESVLRTWAKRKDV